MAAEGVAREAVAREGVAREGVAQEGVAGEGVAGESVACDAALRVGERLLGSVVLRELSASVELLALRKRGVAHPLRDGTRDGNVLSSVETSRCALMVLVSRRVVTLLVVAPEPPRISPWWRRSIRAAGAVHTQAFGAEMTKPQKENWKPLLF